jgi:DEAD/DEAH box helicase domain-containing protein
MDAKGFLKEITSSQDYRGQICGEQIIPARPPRYGQLTGALAETLAASLREAGIQGLYSHQAAAVDLVRQGKNIVVVTGTASGKTLCYNLPVLEAWLQDPESRALYLFPTKALAQDQLKGLRRLTEGWPQAPVMGTYDGDTPPAPRKKLRDEGRIILTNPDMLHQGILPKHTAWGDFFAHLRFVVIDEIHVYRGVFGSQVAGVLRRLQRLCRHYGAQPVFICTSATIANPREHAETLLGQEVVPVTEDGAPASEKHIILWNPALLEATGGVRRSANLEAAELMATLVARRIPTITFTRARVVAELIYRYTVERLQQMSPSAARLVRPYRGGYLPEERREIEEQLFTGRLLGVTSTNALELGIDIGSLEACIIVGYPGTIASFWQQAGRAGRGDLPSLVIFVGLNAPIDQYLLRYQDYLFGKNPEAAVIDPGNPHILLGQLRAAAYEAPLTGRDLAAFGKFAPAVKGLLEEAGEVNPVKGKAYWRGHGFPAGQVNLRNISENTFTILDEESGKAIGTMDEDSAYLQLYTQAVYMHEGETYFVRQLDLDKKVAYTHKAELDYYTQSVSETQIRLAGEEMRKKWRVAEVFFGPVEVMTKPYLFRKIKFTTRESLGFGPIDLPVRTMETCAFWLQPGLELLNRLKEMGRDPMEGLLGVANVLIEVLPLRVMTDPGDLGATVDLANTGRPAIFLYDKYPGGVGFAQRIYEMVEEVFTDALALIAACSCEDGCPSCVGSPVPPASQLDPETTPRGRIPDKEAALVILHDLLEREPYIPKRPRRELSLTGGEGRGEAGGEEEDEVPPFIPLPEKIESRIRRQLKGLQEKTEKMRR